MVFAPHPDDEVFGCGGFLSLLAWTGARISIMVFGDVSSWRTRCRRYVRHLPGFSLGHCVPSTFAWIGCCAVPKLNHSFERYLPHAATQIDE